MREMHRKMKDSLFLKKNQIIISILVCVGLFFLDFASKRFMVQHPDHYDILIPKVLGIELLFNKGVVFGVSINQVVLWVVLIIVLLLLIRILLKAIKDRDSLAVFGLGLIFFGALGNIMDRIVFGGVVDFIRVEFWATFNIADIMITGGVILWAIKLFFQDTKNEKISKK